MSRKAIYGICLSLAFGPSCNDSPIEGDSCFEGARGCSPEEPGPGPGPGPGPAGPDRVDRVGPGTGTDFDPRGDGSSGVKRDDKGNIVLDPGNFVGSMKPIIWVANSAEGTVSKIDTRTLKEVARYVTAPGGGADPSRTTVGLAGDVVVANRSANASGKASAVKIAGDKSGCVDRNANGRIDTFEGAGPVPAQFLWPAGQPQSPDECVLWWTDLSNGGQQTLPRAAGFDAGLGELGGTNVYIGLYGTLEVLRIDAANGKILKRISVAGEQARPYGLVIDKDGGINVQGLSAVVRIDPKAGDAVKSLGRNSCMYGIAADAKGFVYTAGSTCVARINIAGGNWETVQVPGSTFLRGLAVDQNNQVWVADTSKGMFHVDARGAAMVANPRGAGRFVNVPGGNVGAAVDFDGMPWVISQANSKAYKVDPATYATQAVDSGSGPYTYSDMTGFQLRNAGAPAGVYRHTFPGCGDRTRWFDLSWEVMAPSGTQVVVRVRFAGSKMDLQNAAWQQVAQVPPDKSPVKLSVPPGARPDFLQVEFAMKSADSKLTPILSSVSASYSCNILG